MLKAVRNNCVYEKQCENYEEWALVGSRLLDDGFMVHIEGTTFSVVNSKDEIVFIQDKECFNLYIGV
jgi:hypothetical protein